MLGLAIILVLVAGSVAAVLAYKHAAGLHVKVDAVQAAVNQVAAAVKVVK